MKSPAAFAILLSAAATALAPTSGVAQVFKCQQSSGLMVYSDKPCDSERKTSVAEARSMDRAEDEPKSAAELLRALGPDKAIDRNGRVYYRTVDGYVDKTGVLMKGVAQGHR